MQDGVDELLQHISTFCLAREDLVGKWIRQPDGMESAACGTCFDLLSFLQNVKWRNGRGVELVSSIVVEHCKLHRDSRGSDSTFVAFVALSLCREVFRSADVPATIVHPAESAATIAHRQEYLSQVCLELQSLVKGLTCSFSPRWLVARDLVVPPIQSCEAAERTVASVGQSWFRVGQQLAENVLAILSNSSPSTDLHKIINVRERIALKTRVLSSASAQVFRGVAVVEEPGAPQWFIPCRGVPMDRVIPVRRAVLIREWGDNIREEPISGFFDDQMRRTENNDGDDESVDLIVVQCSISREHIALAEGRGGRTVLIGNIGQESMYRLAMSTCCIPNATGRPIPPRTVLRSVSSATSLGLRILQLGCDPLHSESRHSSRPHKVAQIMVMNHASAPSMQSATVLICSATTAGLAAITSSFWKCLVGRLVALQSPCAVPGHGLVECCWISAFQQTTTNSHTSPYASVASRCLESVLRQYLCLILQQSGSLDTDGAESEITRVVSSLNESAHQKSQSKEVPMTALSSNDALFDVLVPRPPLANCTVEVEDRCLNDEVLLADVLEWNVPSHRIADLRAAIEICCVLTMSRVLAFTTAQGVCVF